MRKVVVILSLMLCAGCGGHHALKKESGEAFWLKYTADERGTVMVTATKDTPFARFCAEQAPDVAFNKTADIATKISADVLGKVKADVENQVKTARTAIQLANKTASILLLREALYRLCEVSLNSNVSPDQITALYSNALGVAETIALAEVGQTLQEAAAENAKVAVSANDLKQIEILTGYLDISSDSNGSLNNNAGDTTPKLNIDSTPNDKVPSAEYLKQKFESLLEKKLNKLKQK